MATKSNSFFYIYSASGYNSKAQLSSVEKVQNLKLEDYVFKCLGNTSNQDNQVIFSSDESLDKDKMDQMLVYKYNYNNVKEQDMKTVKGTLSTISDKIQNLLSTQKIYCVVIKIWNRGKQLLHINIHTETANCAKNIEEKLSAIFENGNSLKEFFKLDPKSPYCNVETPVIDSKDIAKAIQRKTFKENVSGKSRIVTMFSSNGNKKEPKNQTQNSSNPESTLRTPSTLRIPSTLRSKSNEQMKLEEKVAEELAAIDKKSDENSKNNEKISQLVEIINDKIDKNDACNTECRILLEYLSPTTKKKIGISSGGLSLGSDKKELEEQSFSEKISKLKTAIKGKKISFKRHSEPSAAQNNVADNSLRKCVTPIKNLVKVLKKPDAEVNQAINKLIPFYQNEQEKIEKNIRQINIIIYQLEFGDVGAGKAVSMRTVCNRIIDSISNSLNLQSGHEYKIDFENYSNLFKLIFDKILEKFPDFYFVFMTQFFDLFDMYNKNKDSDGNDKLKSKIVKVSYCLSNILCVHANDYNKFEKTTLDLTFNGIIMNLLDKQMELAIQVLIIMLCKRNYDKNTKFLLAFRFKIKKSFLQKIINKIIDLLKTNKVVLTSLVENLVCSLSEISGEILNS